MNPHDLCTLVVVGGGLFAAGCTPPPPASATAAPNGARTATTRSPAPPAHWAAVFATAEDTEDGSRRLYDGAAAVVGVGANAVRVERRRSRLLLRGGAYHTRQEAAAALHELKRAAPESPWLAHAAAVYLPPLDAGDSTGYAPAFADSAAEPAPGHYVVRCISLKGSSAGRQLGQSIADALARRGYHPARVRSSRGWVVVEVGAFRRYQDARTGCLAVRAERVGADRFDAAYVVQLPR